MSSLINKYVISDAYKLYNIANSVFSGLSYLKFHNKDIGYEFMIHYLDKNPKYSKFSRHAHSIIMFNLSVNYIHISNYETCHADNTSSCISPYNSCNYCNYCCNNKFCIMINSKEEAIEVASILRSLIINNS